MSLYYQCYQSQFSTRRHHCFVSLTLYWRLAESNSLVLPNLKRFAWTGLAEPCSWVILFRQQSFLWLSLNIQQSIIFPVISCRTILSMVSRLFRFISLGRTRSRWISREAWYGWKTGMWTNFLIDKIKAREFLQIAHMTRCHPLSSLSPPLPPSSQHTLNQLHSLLAKVAA